MPNWKHVSCPVEANALSHVINVNHLLGWFGATVLSRLTCRLTGRMYSYPHQLGRGWPLTAVGTGSGQCYLCFHPRSYRKIPPVKSTASQHRLQHCNWAAGVLGQGGKSLNERRLLVGLLHYVNNNNKLGVIEMAFFLFKVLLFLHIPDVPLSAASAC